MRYPETVTRRHLPHWYVPGAVHFVTYRLNGSLPQSVLQEMRIRKETLLKRNPPRGMTVTDYRQRIHKQLFASYDQSLDRVKDDRLSEPRVAAMIRESLYHHNRIKYHLFAYCVMPNHVHALLQPIDVATGGSLVVSTELATTGEPPVATAIGERPDSLSPLARIMHSLKSYTAHEANQIIGRTGTFWQAESYDHWTRDDNELERIVAYIRGNPAKAGLVERAETWIWSSCHDRFQIDGDTSGWLI